MEKKYLIIFGVIAVLLISGITLNYVKKEKEPNVVYTNSEEYYKSLTEELSTNPDKNPFYVDEYGKICSSDNQCYRDEICYTLCSYGENSTPIRCRVKAGYSGRCMKVPCHEYCTDQTKAHIPCCPIREINIKYDEESIKE